MEFITWYAIAAGSMIVFLILMRVASSVKPLAETVSRAISKHLLYPHLLGRHRLLGPWTRVVLLLYLVYGAINVFFLTFRTSSNSERGRRAGSLALINMGFLFLTMQLSLLANLLGISFHACRRIHGATAWMMTLLLAFHIIVATMVDQKDFRLKEEGNLFAVVGAASVAALVLFSFTIFRRLAFEVFIRTHQCLAAVCMYATWWHLSSKPRALQLCLYIPLAILLLTTLSHLSIFLYQNGILPARSYPYASVMCGKSSKPGANQNEGTPLKLRVALPRPLHVKAGQYVNLWMPTVSLSSWFQTHPFMVTSWSPGKQDVLELFVQTRRGLTETLRARAALDGTASFTAFVSGPYGISKPVDEYETVLAVASGFGIAGVIPYLKQLLYGYNTSSVRVRRLHLVWQVPTLDIAAAAQPLLNSLLADDVLDDGYIIEMSFYVESKIPVESGTPFGEHQRAVIYNDMPEYDVLVSTEASGDYIPRVSNTQEERGKLLVLVSASDKVRDDLRKIVCKYLDRRVRLHEVEFQP
ncbi:hypothetical protein BDV29DRAFT_198977 [Aspergillus leporis]|uniref:ferric-chelate reductase (NADPH) n=1 Tax=Aspergillus leporis TaxID=41062 RepID=A0A5N5WKJ7_9EURO|nr:hypothetical protein BDV29DRAFT_198977 [Aspergillus leporis]